MTDDIFSPDTKITITTHVVRHIDIYDGVPYWRTFTRLPDGTYEASFELIELED